MTAKPHGQQSHEPLSHDQTETIEHRHQRAARCPHVRKSVACKCSFSELAKCWLCSQTLFCYLVMLSSPGTARIACLEPAEATMISSVRI